MAEDVFPQKEAEFFVAQGTFMTTVGAAPATYGVSPAQLAVLVGKQTVYLKARQDNIDLHAKASAQTKALHSAEDAFLIDLRSAASTIHALPGLTPELIAATSLTPHDTVHHVLPAPTTYPLLRLEDHGPLHQLVHVADHLTPTHRAKPHGVSFVELWLKVGDPAPVDDSTCRLIATDSHPPYLFEFAPADLGKTAYWLARWVSPRGKGPWGPVAGGRVNG